MYQYCKHRFGERFDSLYLHWSNRRTGMLCFCEINRVFQDKKRLIPSAEYTQFTIHICQCLVFVQGGQQWPSQILVKREIQ